MGPRPYRERKLKIASPWECCLGGVLIPTRTLEDIPVCAGCGRCCHLVVELRAGDRVPEALVVEHDGARCLEQRSNGACVALDPMTQLCTIYADRPQTCREFDRGGNLCRQILLQPKPRTA